MMVVHDRFDAGELTEIACASDSPQLKRDVAYAAFVNYHNPSSMMCYFVRGVGFVVGQYQRKACRIIGLGTTVGHRRRGIGHKLLALAENSARRHGLPLAKTRSRDGADFYARHGWDVVGMKGGDYLLEKRLLGD